MRTVSSICFLLLLTIPIVHAQENQRLLDIAPADSAPGPRLNRLSVGLERNLSTFNWLGRASLDTTLLGTTIGFLGQFASNTVLLGGAPSANLRSDQQNLSLLLGRRIEQHVTSLLQWNSLVYSDNKSVGLGQAAFHSLLGGARYSPAEQTELSSLIGYRWDRQVGVPDKGVSYTLAANARDIDVGGYSFSGEGQYHEDILKPRNLQQHYLRATTQKIFSENARDSLGVGYGKTRREFYAVANGNIESRIENLVSFTNALEYDLDRDFTTSVFITIQNRSLDKSIRHYSSIPDPVARFNTTIDEFRLETYLQAAYRSQEGRFLATARLAYAERNEQHALETNPGFTAQSRDQRSIEERKNNLSRRTSLAGQATTVLSSSDTISFSGAISILRYDTPVENYDDRDEQLIALSLSSMHRFSPVLSAGLSLEATLSHLVYLYGQTSTLGGFSPSANNYMNRVFRLSSRTLYRPIRQITSYNTFEVLANYTVYDFEQLVSSVQSYSFRQFGWMDSSSVDLTHRVGLDFFGYLKLYENGQLKWSEFSERTENSFVDRTLSSQVRFTPEPGLVFAAGIRYFNQARYVFLDGLKTLDMTIRSLGPSCSIRWDIGTHSRLVLAGWYEKRRITSTQTPANNSVQTLPNLTMNVTVNL
jgi:hypothetical protein